jgi:amidase
MASELWRMGATDLAAAIARKEVKSREAVEAHLARIEGVNPALNAVTVVLAEEARAAADDADRALEGGEAVGPLHGVPMTVKENIDVAGSATTQGIAALAEVVPDVDAPHIGQLRAAGAIPLARANMPDFGLRHHTDNALRGATKNPWDPGRTPGGSSGGDAVAVATGMAPLGMGNDYGGSLRWPSQCCGTATLRPTLGRVARAPALHAPELPITVQLFSVHGPIARHVSDLRVAFESMTGPDASDPWWTPAPLRSPDLPLPVRVAVTVDPAGKGVDPDVAAGVRRAAQALAEAGYAVEEVEPPQVEEACDLWAQLVLAEVSAMFLPLLEQIASADALKYIQLAAEVVPSLDFQGYMTAFARRLGVARAWTQFQEDWPLVLGPVCSMPPFEVGYDTAGSNDIQTLLDALRLAVLVNLLGLPSVAVPVGEAAGLPQGVQIIGQRYREDLCLDAAETVEERLGVITPIDPHT